MICRPLVLFVSVAAVSVSGLALLAVACGALPDVAGAVRAPCGLLGIAHLAAAWLLAKTDPWEQKR